LVDADVLCLASGGGQQGPLLSAAGARVTVYDNSLQQLAQDEAVAAREGLTLRIVEGDMRDLEALADDSFDLIVHPVSNLFVPEVRPVWREAHRVLRAGGVLLAGFMNPFIYIFDLDKLDDEGVLEVKYPLPFADAAYPAVRERAMAEGRPLEHSHTLEAQIGGQLEAGLLLTALYEDRYPEADGDLLSTYAPAFIATRALKPMR
jgi:SAM-dependent methyltransferase